MKTKIKTLILISSILYIVWGIAILTAGIVIVFNVDLVEKIAANFIDVTASNFDAVLNLVLLVIASFMASAVVAIVLGVVSARIFGFSAEEFDAKKYSILTIAIILTAICNIIISVPYWIGYAMQIKDYKQNSSSKEYLSLVKKQKLNKLNTFKNDGVINEEEFNKIKKDIK